MRLQQRTISNVSKSLLKTSSITTLCLSILFSGACSQSAAKSFSSGAVKRYTAGDLMSSVNERKGDPDFEDQVRNFDTAELFAHGTRYATDDSVEFGGHQFDGLKERLSSYQEEVELFVAEHPTVGDVMDANGLNSVEVTEQDLQKIFDNLNRNINLGEAAEWQDMALLQSPTPPTQGQPAPPNAACEVGRGVGAVAGITTTALCAFTAGIGCIAGAVVSLGVGAGLAGSGCSQGQAETVPR